MSSPIAPAYQFPIFASGARDLVKDGAAGATVSGDTGFAVTDDIASEVGQNLLITTDGTDNDCGTANWNSGAVVMAVGRKFGMYANFLHTEGNTDDANWFIGFSDIQGSTFFSDTDALATMDAIGFYKVKDSLFFRTCALNATVQSGATLTTAYASATRYSLRIDGEVGALGYTAKFSVNGVLVATVGPITITAMTKMLPTVAVANGGANAEPMNLFSFQTYAA